MPHTGYPSSAQFDFTSISPHGEPLPVFTPALRYFRYVVALSQADLAEQSGVSRATIRRLEGGGTAWPDTVRALAKVLECTPRALMRPLDGEQIAWLVFQGGMSKGTERDAEVLDR